MNADERGLRQGKRSFSHPVLSGFIRGQKSFVQMACVSESVWKTPQRVCLAEILFPIRVNLCSSVVKNLFQ